MLKHIKRVSYILAALVIGLAIGLKVNKTKTVEVVKEVTVEKVVTVPATLPSTGISEPVPVVAPEPTPEPVTWQQNPNNCNEATQWIAAEAPFYCIDKPVARKTVQSPRSSTITQASAPKTANAVSSVPAGCGHLSSLLQAKGIVGAELDAALNIATRESSCNFNAVNKSSGACRYFQELPCGKWGGDVDSHINGAISYARGRYGSFSGAWQDWQVKKWW